MTMILAARDEYSRIMGVPCSRSYAIATFYSSVAIGCAQNNVGMIFKFNNELLSIISLTIYDRDTGQTLKLSDHIDPNLPDDEKVAILLRYS